jgi:predicted RNase H-like HicB family nuclease
MKYKIVVERSCGNQYTAFSPIATSFCARGATITRALDELRKQLVCFLHDPQAELEIVIASPDNSEIIDLTDRGMRIMK